MIVLLPESELEAFEPLEVEGQLPKELRGTLYRNGPGQFGQFGKRYSHPFEADGAAAQAPTVGSAVAASGAVRGREDVVRELDRLCLWLEHNEPGHPAPLLLRRAQRLMQMNFMEIIREMAPNGLEQVQTVVGPQPEQS